MSGVGCGEIRGRALKRRAGYDGGCTGQEEDSVGCLEGGNNTKGERGEGSHMRQARQHDGHEQHRVGAEAGGGAGEGVVDQHAGAAVQGVVGRLPADEQLVQREAWCEDRRCVVEEVLQ